VFKDLCNEYRSESLRNSHTLGSLPDREGYARMVLVTPVLHFGGVYIATTETLFVAQAYRAGGLGMQLLRMAELVVLLPQGKTNRMQARQAGCVVFSSQEELRIAEGVFHEADFIGRSGRGQRHSSRLHLPEVRHPANFNW